MRKQLHFSSIVIALITFIHYLFCYHVTSFEIRYRPAKVSDIPSIAKLLTTTFESTLQYSNIPIFNLIQQKYIESGYEKQLSKRVRLTSQHAMIVVTETSGDTINTTTNSTTASNSTRNNDSSETIIAFMEIGMLPSPIPIPTTSVVEINNTTITTTTSITDETIKVLDWNSEIISIPQSKPKMYPDMPFLANLVVDHNHRRQKIGSKLVKLALKIASQWTTTTSTIDTDNNQFLNEDTTDTTTTNSNKKNTPSSSSSSLFLSVDKENTNAALFYDNLGFKCVLDEEKELSFKLLKKLRKSRNPRIYYQKMLS